MLLLCIVVVLIFDVATVLLLRGNLWLWLLRVVVLLCELFCVMVFAVGVVEVCVVVVVFVAGLVIVSWWLMF